MPAEITMPQLSDTMTEGVVVKWHKKEGDKIKSGEEIADIETDKATMPMEAFDAGTLAVILVGEGQKVKVGDVIGVIATGSEKPDEIKKKYASGGAKPAATAPSNPAAPAKSEPAALPAKAQPAASAKAPPKAGNYQYDIIVIGGGPAGYAAAIRAGQLKQRVLCIEKENLGGTCLNWGCIPTKALLDDGAFIRKLRLHSAEHGVSFKDLNIDFGKLIARSRGIADKLSKGIGFLFDKNSVKKEAGVGQVIAPHKVKITGPQGTKDVTAQHIIIATGARATPLPGVAFDGKKIITSREAMNLPKQPKKIAIIGAGAIGCEFADFYNAIGTEVVIVEMLDHLLPIEDEDVSVLLERTFQKREIDVRVKTKTDKVETTANGVKLTLSGAKPGVVEADVVLVAIGVTGNTEGLADPKSGLDIFKSRVRVDHEYKTNLENVWAVGDCVVMHSPPTGPEPSAASPVQRHPDLAHVAHHEAVLVVERIVGFSEHEMDYKFIPGCTYTHPQVASMGMTEKKARENGRKLKIGKFPFSASGRALAAGEPDGFVKLIFDAEYGELLGVHMIGEAVTELLAELVLAKKLEATEAEIIEAIHPHPTFSEAVMEAAGKADDRAIHI
jgi:dihydrolipoamide dehydrogenase